MKCGDIVVKSQGVGAIRKVKEKHHPVVVDLSLEGDAGALAHEGAQIFLERPQQSRVTRSPVMPQ